MVAIFDIYTFIGILSAGQAFIIIGWLFSKNTDAESRPWLALLLLILSFNVVHDTLIQSQLLVHFPHFLYTGEALNYLIWPFLFFYVKGKSPLNLNWKNLFHFLPFLLFNLDRWSLYAENALIKEQIINGFYEQYLSDIILTHSQGLGYLLEDFLLWRLQGLIYICLIARYFVIGRKPVSNDWVVNSFVLLWGIRYCSHLLPYIQDISINLNNQVEILSRAVIIFLIAQHRPIPRVKTDTKSTTYSSSGLGEREAEALSQQLLSYFNNNQPYLRPDLTLSTLAGILKTNTRYLSQVIHSYHGKNYTDFVNTYRVQEVKHRLQDKKYCHLTLEAITKDAGFNSLTTCQRAFKKLEGQPPSSFRIS